MGDYKTKFFGKDLEVVPNIDDHYKNLKYKTRVIAFIFDKDEYKEEVKALKFAAKYLANRENLRIGIVDDPKLVKKFKNYYGMRWFSSVSLSGLVL